MGGLAPTDDLPPEYWQALLDDPRADWADRGPGASGRALRLDQIPENLLRVGCRRCGRTVEIQKVDAVRLYGPNAIWWHVGQRLLDNTCASRTGRYELLAVVRHAVAGGRPWRPNITRRPSPAATARPSPKSSAEP
jgi:hypothetical protein